MASDRMEADIVVIGGGVLGCSIAYQLGKAGARDALLVEKQELTHGSTWHAAGMVGQLRASKNVSRMLQRSVAIYDGLEAETGLATGWRRTGSLRLASTDERMLEIRRSKTLANSVGLEAEVLTPTEARALFPILDTDGLRGALLVPSDGVADPTSLTLSLAAGARRHGVTIKQGITVTGFNRRGNRITHVVTDQGEIACRVIVNAAGVWARELGAMMGASLACCGLEHQYLVTEAVEGLTADMPSLRDPDLSIYYKPEANGLVVGAWEPDTVSFDERGVPASFGRELLPPVLERMEPFLEAATRRTPVFSRLGIRDVVNGPIPFSADGDLVMGPIPGLDNAFVASGCVVGIAAGGGVGEVLAEWIMTGEPPMDLWPVDARRFGPLQASRAYLYPRAIEIYGDHYRLQPPGHEHRSARGLRRSPLYHRLKDQRAVYGSKFGWERPNWFAPEGCEMADAPSFDRPNWFEPVAREHRVVREGVALFDLTSFAKFEIHGADAPRSLQHLAVRNIDVPVGTTIYTQLCNARGGIEADVTITRLSDDRFYYVTGTGNGVRDTDWIRRNAPEGARFAIDDATSSWAVLLLTGPNAPAVLKELVGAAALERLTPFGTFQEVGLGTATVRALRVSFTGEVGWELHIPVEFACHVYDLLWQAGESSGIANCGYRALDSLRMEKGLRYWGSDITPDYNPYEAGLGFCVDLDKGPFLARDALRRIKQAGVGRKLSTLTIDEPVAVFGGEAVLRDGRILATTTSGAFGHSIGKPIVYAYLPADQMEREDFELEVYGKRLAARRQHARDLLPQQPAVESRRHGNRAQERPNRVGAETRQQSLV